MARHHFIRTLRDGTGALVPGSSVRILDPDSTTLITDTIYASDTGSDVKTNPWVCNDGTIDFYLNVPRIVRVGVSRPGEDERFYENLEVGSEDSVKETFSFTVVGALSPSVGDLRFYIDEACEVIRVRANCGVQPVGGNVGIDVKKDGVSIFDSSNPAPVITPTGAPTAYTDFATPVPLAAEDYLTLDITSVGTTTPGSNLVVQVRVRRL